MLCILLFSSGFVQKLRFLNKSNKSDRNCKRNIKQEEPNRETFPVHGKSNADKGTLLFFL
jgi:hypothetical protein